MKNNTDKIQISQKDTENYEELKQFILNLLYEPVLPALPEVLKEDREIVVACECLSSLRQTLLSFGKGIFTEDLKHRGIMTGALKSLQANLNHLNWQVKMVSEGDFTQRVDSMGELSEAFNKMISQLEQSFNDLTLQKENLRKLTEDLHNEIIERAHVELALRKSERRYRNLARIDPLTELYNRRYFFELAVPEVERLGRTGGQCCICMIDIDHFKRFNDTYGHVAGDECLKHVGGILQQQVRKIDLCGRYGGEEFIILLPQTNLRSALGICERIRAAIELHPCTVDDDKNAFITVSIGVTEILYTDVVSQQAKNIIVKAIRNADQALYAAKKHDRNRVVTYTRPQNAPLPEKK